MRGSCSVARGKRPTEAFPDPSNSYSPDLNPIEMVLSKLKALIRKVAARTYDEPWQTSAMCATSSPTKNATLRLSRLHT
ncbi:hypothetical protein D3P04_04175 [Paracoccus onubensis]|uniref:Tc1-like transposase DDE domain-containing protein n=1 Tax=Paracoccus onubensis TaxID=1675788 RepID=A0A418T4M9_9RHOB|nr:hypothetical protein D3P04_04175 [Paracoccus onubensis]